LFLFSDPAPPDPFLLNIPLQESAFLPGINAEVENRALRMKSPKNIPASVRQRLLNREKNDKRPFNELLQYYAMKRFLFRLSQSAHADRFILKEALMDVVSVVEVFLHHL